MSDARFHAARKRFVRCRSRCRRMLMISAEACLPNLPKKEQIMNMCLRAISPIFGRTNPIDRIRRLDPPAAAAAHPPLYHPSPSLDSLGFFRPTCVNVEPRHDPVRAAQSSRAPGSRQCFRNETNAARARVLGSRFARISYGWNRAS